MANTAQDSEDMTPEGAERLLDDHCAKLMEHFDSVQIFVNKVVGKGTRHISRGTGNWFARKGQIQHWLTISNHRDIKEEDANND